eukprot:CAMPEP_0194493440 /NCGR_PEP_ID=MMETSP0253-20130528/11651_1 /TAXON_ID=2966 /ORGANISM="Noctiluca scintillans" /LENGTH=475 /DNA_ID=CAMNT_0039334425 /DNA_START=29 /DNA_END=1456 /DNA_ORIENTATION=+
MALTSERAKNLDAWCKKVGSSRSADLGFEESSAILRDCLKRELLKMTDLRDDPAWFFEAHRILSSNRNCMGSGFWTRFTVQFNLFAGTVIAAGSDAQVAELAAMQAAGELGCFGLTEKFAGVNSGMVVETVAEFDAATREFIITSPYEGAYKNWISQGFCADRSVTIADLRIGGKSHGPHAFLFNFRREGKVLPGIRLADMGRKTVSNDLDNAWIAFDGLRVPVSALLDRYVGIDEQGQYVQKKKGMHTMEMVGQRLFTGRVAVAQASLIFGRVMFEQTKRYTDSKLCWAPKGARPPLTALPQLSSLYAEADEALSFAERYAKLCEDQLCECLRSNQLPPPKLVEGIAVAKIRSVESVIHLVFRLKQAVGSFALMDGSGFESTDTMQVAKFAEGSSYVLLQKIARDRVKQTTVVGASADENALAAELRTIGPSEWMTITNAQKVYQLAELVMDRTMQEWTGAPAPKGIARPFGRL